MARKILLICNLGVNSLRSYDLSSSEGNKNENKRQPCELPF